MHPPGIELSIELERENHYLISLFKHTPGPAQLQKSFKYFQMGSADFTTKPRALSCQSLSRQVLVEVENVLR
jgi:alpha-D-ribose 1-methylphosphonate 5-triphosphate diphosphatase PhnM